MSKHPCDIRRGLAGDRHSDDPHERPEQREGALVGRIGLVEPYELHPEWSIYRRLREDDTLLSDDLATLAREQQDLRNLARLADAVELQLGAGEIRAAAMTAVRASELDSLPVETRTMDWSPVVRDPREIVDGRIQPLALELPVHHLKKRVHLPRSHELARLVDRYLRQGPDEVALDPLCENGCAEQPEGDAGTTLPAVPCIELAGTGQRDPRRPSTGVG